MRTVIIIFLMALNSLAQSKNIPKVKDCTAERDSINLIFYRNQGIKSHYEPISTIKKYESCILQMDSVEIMRDFLKLQPHEYNRLYKTGNHMSISDFFKSSCCSGEYYLCIYFDVKTRKPSSILVRKREYGRKVITKGRGRTMRIR